MNRLQSKWCPRFFFFFLSSCPHLLSLFGLCTSSLKIGYFPASSCSFLPCCWIVKPSKWFVHASHQSLWWFLGFFVSFINTPHFYICATASIVNIPAQSSSAGKKNAANQSVTQSSCNGLQRLLRRPSVLEKDLKKVPVITPRRYPASVSYH